MPAEQEKSHRLQKWEGRERERQHASEWVSRLKIARLVETSGFERVRIADRAECMRESCVAASQVHLQLELEVLLRHAYFTVPLRHQVSTVSLFHVISSGSRLSTLSVLPCLSWTLCILLCNMCTAARSVQQPSRGRPNQTVTPLCV